MRVARVPTDWVFLHDKMILLPDERLTPGPGDEYHPMRGYGFVLAVRRGEAWSGFVEVDALGFSSVKEWMEAQRELR